MHKILAASKSFGFGAEPAVLRKLFEKHNFIPDYTHLSDAEERLAEFDGIIIGTEKITAEHFKKTSNLKAVIKYGVGTDNIDRKAAQDSGIEVLSLPGINCDAVAEMAFSLMMSAARQVAKGDRTVRNGQWLKLMGVSVQGKTLGILGTGAIGRNLARMVSGLEMKVLGYDVYQSEEFTVMGGVYVEFEDLLRRSDFISIHTPLLESTYHLIGAKQFKLMKREAILINTSRGPVVDEDALYQALKNKQIAGAALDVFEKEPLGKSRLLELNNLVCTPHIAAYTYETLRRMDEECLESLSRVLK